MALMVDDLLELCKVSEPALLVFTRTCLLPRLSQRPPGPRSPPLHRAAHRSQRPRPRGRRRISHLAGVRPGCAPRGRVYSGTTLTVCPPSLDPGVVGLRGGRDLAPVSPADGESVLPVSLANPEHPLVYVTLGTFSNNDLELFRLVFKALEDEPFNVWPRSGGTRTLGPGAHTQPMPAWSTTSLKAEVPPHCAAVVHHAGAGTMFGVLAHGLPSVDTPSECRQFRQCRPARGGGRGEQPHAGRSDGRRSRCRAPDRARHWHLAPARTGARRRDRRHAFARDVASELRF